MVSAHNSFLAGLLLASIGAVVCQSGSGTTTRYWDCCKPSCAWSENAGDVTAPVRTCAAGGTTTVSKNVQSGCNGGNAFVCNNQKPFVKNGQAYAFAAAKIAGLSLSQQCCACFKLTFTSTAIAGKSLIVQVINTGNDLTTNQFDLQIPAGGFGSFTQGCPKQWPSTPAANWGSQYGGVSNRASCSAIPSALVSGCQFRFDWMRGADNPKVNYQKVTCPTALTDISKCIRRS
ncbi:hypothetical protein ONE63_000523 [Megalurothrips usitatus]|uniref:Cellulase n=1 Tax=Megalurothrips usitatus TaxID=439358 RepID=A0AAV7Y186_9NEOP|nr:hypothetical protein ONE63_000523 [Megalurothrips usitatus]